MKTRLMHILLAAAFAFLLLTPSAPHPKPVEPQQVAAVRWTPNDPKPGFTG